MYGEKKSALTWTTQIFLGVSVLILIGAIAFGVMATRNGGVSFKNMTSGDSKNPLSLNR